MKSRTIAPHGFPKHLSIRENGVDRFGHPAQTFGSLLVLAREIADPLGRGGIAHLQLGKNQIFLRVMINFRIDFKMLMIARIRFILESFAKLFCWESTNFLTAAEAFDVSGLGGPRQLRSIHSALVLFILRRCL
jgi:hypothetical protein